MSQDKLEYFLMGLIIIMFFIGVVSFVKQSIDVLIILAVCFVIAIIILHYLVFGE